jgi:hypothetical protein
LHQTRLHFNNAKRLFTSLASIFLISLSTRAPAETMTLELSTLPDAEPTTALPGAIEIEGDKLNLYLDRKMRASGNAVISKATKKYMATILNMTSKMMN